MLDKERNFIRQQGYAPPRTQTCSVQYRGLQFQPRVIGVIMLTGVILRSPGVFLALSGVLWWSALVPARNPFEGIYNHFIAARRGLPLLVPAPNARRFAQGLAAGMLGIIGLALLGGIPMVAWLVTAFLFAALAAILFGGFCFGSFLFHLITGNAAFARRTLPWARGA